MNRWKYRMDHGDVRAALYGDRNAKLPVEGKAVTAGTTVKNRLGEEIGTFTFRVLPFVPRIWRGVRVKSSVHRVQVMCPNCGKWTPAGRLHQHIGTAACDRENA